MLERREPKPKVAKSVVKAAVKSAVKSPLGTRERILRAAVNEFAAKGFSGGRIETICAAARVNIRMIYHHFGGKEGLYIAALEETLTGLRAEELKLDFEAASPMEAMLQLFEFTYEHFAAHPRLISLLSGENLLKAKYLKRSKSTPVISSPVLTQLQNIIERGEAEGLFRRGIDPLQLYVLIVSLSYFHLSNGHTLSVLFKQDVYAPDWLAEHKQIARDVVVRYVKLPD